MIIPPETIRNKIQPVLTGFSEIVAAYLFGSVAKGRARPGSDVDIALLLDATVRPNVDLLLNLQALLCRALRADVHLIILNNASYLLRMQVFTEGRLIYETDREKLARFRMLSTSLYAEFAPVMRMTQQGLRNRLERSHNG